MADQSAQTDELTSRKRIKRALSHGKAGRISKDTSNKVMLGVFQPRPISRRWCSLPSSLMW